MSAAPRRPRDGAQTVRRSSAWLLAALAWGALAATASASPRLVVTPPCIDFPADGGLVLITLENLGDEALTIRRVGLAAVAAGFSVPTLEKTLGPGERTTLPVSYHPAADATAGLRQAENAVVVGSDDPQGLPLPQRDPDEPAARVTSVALRAGRPLLLSSLLLMPLLGAALVLLLPRRRLHLARGLTVASAVGVATAALWLLTHFDRDAALRGGHYGAQYVEHRVLLGAAGIEYHLGVDGLSIGLVALIAVVGLVAAGASGLRTRGEHALLLTLESSALGAVLALDLALFAGFFIVVSAALVALFAARGQRRSARTLGLLGLLSGGALVLAVVAIAQHAVPTLLVDGRPASYSFDLLRLTWDGVVHFDDPERLFLGAPLGRAFFVLLAVAFAAPLAWVPLHGWVAAAVEELPVGVALFVVALWPRLAAYALVRVGFGLVPGAAVWAADAAAGVGAAQVVLGALGVVTAPGWSRRIAWITVAQSGLTLLGLGALTQAGLAGAFATMAQQGLAAALLVLGAAALDGDRHAAAPPRRLAVVGLALAAALGLPGLPGFWSELLVLLGAFADHRAAVVAAGSGAAILAVAGLASWCTLRAASTATASSSTDGEPSAPRVAELDGRVLWLAAPIALLLVGCGLFPGALVSLSERALYDLVAHLTRHGGAGAIALLW